MFPKDKQALEGEKVTFYVKVTGIPQPILKWYHNEEDIVADHSKELAADGSLTFPSAELKNSGVYRLVATNTAGSVEKRVILLVQQEGCKGAAACTSKKETSFPPIPVDDFGDYVSQCHASDNEDFRKQFTVGSVVKGVDIVSFICTMYRRLIRMIIVSGQLD